MSSGMSAIRRVRSYDLSAIVEAAPELCRESDGMFAREDFQRLRARFVHSGDILTAPLKNRYPGDGLRFRAPALIPSGRPRTDPALQLQVYDCGHVWRIPTERAFATRKSTSPQEPSNPGPGSSRFLRPRTLASWPAGGRGDSRGHARNSHEPKAPSPTLEKSDRGDQAGHAPVAGNEIPAREGHDESPSLDACRAP